MESPAYEQYPQIAKLNPLFTMTLQAGNLPQHDTSERFKLPLNFSIGGSTQQLTVHTTITPSQAASAMQYPMKAKVRYTLKLVFTIALDWLATGTVREEFVEREYTFASPTAKVTDTVTMNFIDSATAHALFKYSEKLAKEPELFVDVIHVSQGGR